MSKKQRYSNSSQKQSSAKSYADAQYKDRNLAAMSPEKAQEACKPTEAEPVRLQTRMAGCS